MLNVAEPSEIGSHVALEAEKVGEGIQRPYHQGPWDLDLLVDLQEGLAASGVVSGVASMVVEEEAALEGASKIVEATVVVVEVVSATKAAGASQVEEASEVTAAPMGMVLPLMRLLAPEVESAVVLVVTEVAVVLAEEGTGALDPLIAMEIQRQLVGMIRVVAVAHMMTETVDIVAAEATTTVTARLVEAAAIWSR
jgi:hypothetical protein